jgi:GNAT superfamily N-acetyltransferase
MELCQAPALPPGFHVRAIGWADKEALSGLFEQLSDRSRRRRFLVPKPRLSARELAYFTEIDHLRHAALVAVAPDGSFAAVARYACAPGETREADIAVAVADAWQGRGIGTLLAGRIVERARLNGIVRMVATTLAENRPALRLLRGLGFRVTGADASGIELALTLTASAALAA